MKKLVCLFAAGLLVASTVGCANGPIRNWLRGAPCNSCQPALQPSCGTQALGTCTDGCGTTPTFPNPVVQPGLSSNDGITPPVTDYYSQGDPTTQSYATQPVAGAQPVYGNIPNGQFNNGAQVFGTGAIGNVLSPPNGAPNPGPNGF